MASGFDPQTVVLCILVLFCAVAQSVDIGIATSQAAWLTVNASQASARKIPNRLFGVFFEEINHAGAGGLWAELVRNRGFEAGGRHSPSDIFPWSRVGDDSSIILSTELTSPFEENKVALRVDVLCGSPGANLCPDGGVGIYNPGYWGMNIEQGKTYKLVFFVRSLESINVAVSLMDSTGLLTLASSNIIDDDVSKWTRKEVLLEAIGSNTKSSLHLRTAKKGVIWIDQVSLMPTDTYKGHGFRPDLFKMVADLKPGFIRFPGGCYVEGEWLRNAFRWKETVGPWEQRPGHFGDVWNYWTDDGFGQFEFLQLAEDLGASPVWVVNNGIGHQDQVNTSNIIPFVQEALDGIEFARGDPKSTWGSVRAAMGHPEPFDLKHVAIGNEDCYKPNYIANYVKFFNAIKKAYPDIQLVSNCDGSRQRLDHPADLYDFHVYTDSKSMFSMASYFDHSPRSGPNAFISEYAVWKDDAANGSLLAAVAEAGFLIGVEKNSDLVSMASYAPLFVNDNNRGWTPDAIVFDSSQHYGTPSYWMQHFFKESNGATLLSSTIEANSSTSLLAASTITFRNSTNNNDYLRIKVVNFGLSPVNLKISIVGLGLASVDVLGSTKTELTSANVMDQNSFQQPNKIVPVQSLLDNAGKEMEIDLAPHSLTSFDFLTRPSSSTRMRVVRPIPLSSW